MADESIKWYASDDNYVPQSVVSSFASSSCGLNIVSLQIHMLKSWNKQIKNRTYFPVSGLSYVSVVILIAPLTLWLSLGDALLSLQDVSKTGVGSASFGF